jgi:hypothetical protein
MSRDSENIVRQWEEQKQLQKDSGQLEKVLIQMIKAPKPKAKKAPKKKK